MNQYNGRYSLSNQDENLQSNIERNQAIIQKQNEQIAKLREYFVQLRNRFHEERKNFTMKSLSYQRAIEQTKRKGDRLELRINEIISSMENAENEKIANELIEKIWSTLKDFRKEIFEESENISSGRHSNHKEDCSKNVKYGSTMKKIKSKSRKSNSNAILESDSESFDFGQPLSSPIDLNQNLNIKTPTNSDNDEIIVTPTISTKGNDFCDSIASRRTRRKCSTNVYYKEPSLRSALTPGDPFTFSLEDGFVTPTVPDDFSRDAPNVNLKRGRRKNH